MNSGKTEPKHRPYALSADFANSHFTSNSQIEVKASIKIGEFCEH